MRNYSWEFAARDLQAGMTVAVFAVPQAMAYAMLAGIPPVHGLYAAIVMSIVAALSGSSAFVNTGPTNSAAMLTGAALAPFAGSEHFLAILFGFTLMVGVLRLAMGLLRLGYLLDYVPESSFLGFTVGVGLLIALGQLHHLLGVSASTDPTFVGRVVDVVSRVESTNFYALAIGLGAFLIMATLDRFNRRFPVALLAIVAATVAAASFPQAGVTLVRDLAPIPAGLPGFSLPMLDLTLIRELWPGALAVAVIGLIEAVSIGQSLALRHQQQLDFDREFNAQGISHIVSAFFQGMPGSGSFSRSLLIEQTGGKTCLANVYFGVATALGLLLGRQALNLIPVAALAGLLLFVSWKLVDFQRVRRVMLTTRHDLIVMLLTLLTTVFVRIEYGIFVGIIVAAVIQLGRSRTLRLNELIPAGDSFEEIPYDTSKTSEQAVVAVTVAGDLFYGVSNLLRRELETVAEQRRPTHLILRVRGSYSLDYSCWSALFDFAGALRERGGTLLVCGVSPDVQRVLQSADMESRISEEQVFPATGSLFQAFRSCLRVAFRDLPPDAPLPPAWKDYAAKL